MAFATDPRFVYVHKWQVGDLVIWDNRCTLHRASPFEFSNHVRAIRRTTVIDVRGDTPPDSAWRDSQSDSSDPGFDTQLN